MEKVIPTAALVSKLVKKDDGYWMCLLDDKEEPFAQWGWPAHGWREFAERILQQMAAFEQVTNVSAPLQMIAREMHLDAFSKALDFDKFKEHIPYSFIIQREDKNADDLTVIIRTRKITRVQST